MLNCLVWCTSADGRAERSGRTILWLVKTWDPNSTSAFLVLLLRFWSLYVTYRTILIGFYYTLLWCCWHFTQMTCFQRSCLHMHLHGLSARGNHSNKNSFTRVIGFFLSFFNFKKICKIENVGTLKICFITNCKNSFFFLTYMSFIFILKKYKKIK